MMWRLGWSKICKANQQATDLKGDLMLFRSERCVSAEFLLARGGQTLFYQAFS